MKFTAKIIIIYSINCSVNNKGAQQYDHCGLTEVSVKKDFTPRVTHGTIFHQRNLE